MNYEAVFIDWDGTLSNSRFWERWRDDEQYTDRYDKIQSSLFKSPEENNYVQHWMTGFMDHKFILNHLAKTTDIPRQELWDELRYSAENMKFIDESVLPKIQRLRDMSKLVVIATDNMDTFDKWTVPAMGLYEHFDDVLNSSSLRVMKSEISPMYSRSKFFFQYLKEMGIAPEETVLIDNSLGTKCLESVGINFMHVTDLEPLSFHLDTILKDY
jgi:FMN phosphatase YigB (HAD superfamily)